MLKVSRVAGGAWVWVALVSLLQNVCTTWGGFCTITATSVKYLHNLVEPASFAEYFHNLKKVFTTCNFCRIFTQPCTSCTTCRVFAQTKNGFYSLHICTFCRIFAQPAEVGAMCTHGLVMIGATSLSILSAPPPPCHRRRGQPSPPPPPLLLHELFKDAWLVDMWSKFRNICNCHLDKSAVQTMHLKPDC